MNSNRTITVVVVDETTVFRNKIITLNQEFIFIVLKRNDVVGGRDEHIIRRIIAFIESVYQWCSDQTNNVEHVENHLHNLL